MFLFNPTFAAAQLNLIELLVHGRKQELHFIFVAESTGYSATVVKICFHTASTLC
jgi:hypothetical protein